MMKLMDKNAMFALESLEANKEKFKNRERYEKIENNIKMIILKFTLSYLNDQEIEAKYVDYDTEKIENGYKNIDVQLIKDLIYYISKKCNNLYKVKLMKLLWYIDNLYYNQYGKAMTGLVYTHQKMGALPIGNEEIMKFNCIKVEEIINENSDDVLVGYHIKPNEDYEFKGLKKDQKKIVDNKYADIDVQLERRADLIPNLVNTVKGYVEHEDDAIEKVTTARENLVNAKGIEEKANANNELSNALNNLMVIVEKYW